MEKDKNNKHNDTSRGIGVDGSVVVEPGHSTPSDGFEMTPSTVTRAMEIEAQLTDGTFALSEDSQNLEFSQEKFKHLESKEKLSAPFTEPPFHS